MHGGHHLLHVLAAALRHVHADRGQLIGLGGIFRILFYGDCQLFHGGRGFLQGGGLFLGAHRQVGIAGSDLRGAHVDLIDPLAHGCHGAGQAFLHPLERGEKDTDLIVGASLHALSQIACRDAVKVSACLLQRTQHGAPDEGPAQRRQQQGGRYQRDRRDPGGGVGLLRACQYAVAALLDPGQEGLHVFHEVGVGLGKPPLVLTVLGGRAFLEVGLQCVQDGGVGGEAPLQRLGQLLTARALGHGHIAGEALARLLQMAGGFLAGQPGLVHAAGLHGSHARAERQPRAQQGCVGFIERVDLMDRDIVEVLDLGHAFFGVHPAQAASQRQGDDEAAQN